MRRFKVKINDSEYLVEVEEIESREDQGQDSGSRVEGELRVAAERGDQGRPATDKKIAAGIPIKAPLRGTVIELRCSPGQTVEKGQTVVILEAMKLENEISAPATGRVASVFVEEGAAVEAGDLLLTIDADTEKEAGSA